MKHVSNLDIQKLTAQAAYMDDMQGDGLLLALRVAYQSDPSFHDCVNAVLKR